MSDPSPEAIQTLAAWWRDSHSAVAFSGVGITTESGIPDFRSPGGVWSRHKPVMFQDCLRDPEARRRCWQIRMESTPVFL